MISVSITPFPTFESYLLWLARRYLFVREVGGQNKGVWVQLFQQYTDTHIGDSWCASYVSYILGLACAGYSNAPLPRTASCDVLLEYAKSEGICSDLPHVGDVFLLLNSSTDAHHTGFVSVVKSPSLITTIAGNTSPDGKSSNGNGCYEHDLAVTTGTILFVRYPRPPILGVSLPTAA